MRWHCTNYTTTDFLEKSLSAEWIEPRISWPQSTLQTTWPPRQPLKWGFEMASELPSSMKLQTGQNKIQYLSPKLSWLRIWAKNFDAETLAPWLQLPVASDRQLKSIRTRPNSQPKFLSHIAKWCLGLSLIISKPSFCPRLWWLVNTPGSST